MTGPQRIQQRRTRGWRKPIGVVSVARGTEWGNPFVIGQKLGRFESTSTGSWTVAITITRELAVELFRAYVIEKGWVEQIQSELRGKDLMCWCSLADPCHADVLLALANGPTS